MSKCESMIQIFDIIATMIIFIISCFVGKIFVDYYGDTWVVFNVPTFVTVIIGEFVWFIIRCFIKKFLKKKIC